MAVLLFCTTAMAATRIAIVGTDAGTETSKVLDLALAEFKGSKDIEVLERAQIDRVLREQEFSLGNRTPDAERAVKAGQLLRVDLFAVLEGGGPKQPYGVVVFDAQTGVRYADAAVIASNIVSAARGTAKAIQQATEKFRRRSRNLRTVGVLSVRNADLPGALDSFCDITALLLERELIGAPDIAILERRRLEPVNRERKVVNGAGDALLPSLRMLDLEFSRDGNGVRAVLTVTSFDGQAAGRTNASVPTMNMALLSQRLADAVMQVLDIRSMAPRSGILAEAKRFGREAEMLIAHGDYAAALRRLEAAHALDPSNTNFQYRLVRLLPDAAMEIIDPGGQRWHRSLTRRLSNDELALALSLGHRGADLLRDLCLEAAAATGPEQPVPLIMKSDAYGQLARLMEKLGDPMRRGTAHQDEMASLGRKERDIRIEIIEPFFRARVRDRKSFEELSAAESWFALGERRGTFDLAQWQRDVVLVTQRWLEVAKKFNPPDGSGYYYPLFQITSGTAGAPFAERLPAQEPIWAACDAADDPVLQAFGKFGRAMGELAKPGRSSASQIEVERTLRLWLQEEITRLPAAETNVRSKLLGMIDQALRAVMNNRDDWKEYWSACQFALEQRAARPLLFNTALVILSSPRNNRTAELYELAGGVLKLISERPEAFSERDRNQTGTMCRQYRDRYAPAPVSTTNAPAPWTRALKLFTPSPRRDALGWLFRPVVEGGSVYAACLGLEGESNRNEVLRLVRVPLDGSGPSLLGRVKFHDAIAANMHQSAEFAWSSKPDVARPIQIQHPPRAACVAAGRYFLATHLGVFIFPLDGGAPELLCGTNGLPSDDAHSVAFLNGRLYVGAGEPKRAGYLIEYDPATRSVKTLASSRRKEVASPFDDQVPFQPAFLWADEARERLLMLAATQWSGKLGGWWSFAPRTGRFRQLAPLKARSEFGTWGGQVAPGVVGAFDLSGVSLWEADAERFLLKYERNPNNEEPSPIWPARHEGGMRILHPPLMWHQGWLWWAEPFQRVSLDGTKREELPPLPGATAEHGIEYLRLLDDGRRVLAGNRAGVWLLELTSKDSTQAQSFPARSNE